MADEDITLDGKPLQSLRVADLKAALEERNLPKSGQKNTLIKRLKGALMLENLQKSSSSHSGLQPNSQIGEEMSQNSFIQQYLAKQQELLRQRLEREAQQKEDADDSSAVPEEDEDHSEDNEGSPYVSDKQQRSRPSQPSMTRTEEKGGDSVMGHGIMECSSGMGRAPTLELAGTKMQRTTYNQGHKEPPAPSPPRAIASLSVRVLGQPDRQGLPPTIPRTHEKAGTAPSEPGSAHPILHLSQSARVSAGGRANEDSDEDESDDDESEDDEDWGPGPGGAQRGNRAPPQPKKLPPSVPTTFARSKRKLQPPQHIPPPQAHHTPMQLRHPTPPPSPPPDLFPLPDTPKQSPPDEQESPEARGPSAVPFPPPMQRQESDSSSRSSSPEPPAKRRPGPLSRLVHKMESEGAFQAAEASSAVDLSGETVHSNAGPASSSKSPPQQVDRRTLQDNQDMKEEKESEQEKMEEQQREKKFLEEEKERERKRLQEEKKLRHKEEQEKERKQQEEVKERERKHQEEEKEKERRRQEEDKDKKRGEKLQKAVTEAQDSDSSSGSDSKSDSSSRSSQSSSSSSSQGKDSPARQMKKLGHGREEVEDDQKNNPSKGAEKCHLSQRMDLRQALKDLLVSTGLCDQATGSAMHNAPA